MVSSVIRRTRATASDADLEAVAADLIVALRLARYTHAPRRCRMVRSSVSSRSLIGAVLVTAASCLAAPMGAEVVNLTSVHDTTLYEDPAGTTSNGAGSDFFAGRNGNGPVRRGLVSFDVSGAIPHGSTINAVTLSLSMYYTLDDTPS